MSEPFTPEQFKLMLPKQFKGNITQEMMDDINEMLDDPIKTDHFRENLVSYVSIIKESKYKLTDYIKAVKYVSLKMMGSTNVDAYLKTFPDRAARFLREGTSQKDISSFVANYNKNKLVNLIAEQTLVPFHILNRDYYQQALGVQVELMTDPKISPKVRCDAANSVLTHLKPPETSKIQLDMNVKSDGMIEQLRQTMLEFSANQLKSIEIGTQSVKDIAHSELVIEGDYVEV